jgi:STE24 endopeptidase
LNKSFYQNPSKQDEAKKLLGINDEAMAKTLSYSLDKYKFGAVSAWFDIAALLIFLMLGGLGVAESWARGLSEAIGRGPIVTGLFFFGLLGLASAIVGLPFELYHTFVLEQKHGFNRQTVKGFWLDKLKGLIVGLVLGTPILAAILWIMESMGKAWWIYAWLAIFLFSLLTVWLYPVLLAPLFNKFRPLEEGELREKIDALAQRINFKTDGISIMDASKRSSHGNAYFTGIFGKKRIVLFDTLVGSMNIDEVVAVLAHELGHFKLHHVRGALIRSFFVTGLTFFLLGQFLPMETFYKAFSLAEVSNYGALLVFSLWLAPFSFVLQPITHYFSQRNEFAADKFAIQNIEKPSELYNALLKLRETSHVMPISHPLYSKVYLSHPPLMERLSVLHP